MLILYLLAALLLGIVSGTITGLAPGIHTNLLAVFLVAASSYLLLYVSPIILIVFIVSMAITHTFVDFIPSIYLGAPDEDTALSTMPGHRFLLKGNAHEAVLLTLIGSGLAIFISVLIAPLFIFIIPKIYGFIEKMMAFILIWISIFLISKEKNSKILALIIFIFAGFLGIATLNLNINQPLLPLLTGLFGSSTLVYSLSQKTKIPKQKIGKIIFNKKQLIKPAIATSLVSPICSFLPGLGSSQAAIIASELVKISKKQFLILLGSVNTLVMSMSFVTLYLIEKSRTGAASAISQISQINLSSLIYIFITIIISSAIAILITIKISKIFAKNIAKINYSKISIIILLFLSLIVFYFSSFLGFFIFTISTLLGLMSISFSIRRGFLMGSLLIPTILFYLPF